MKPILFFLIFSILKCTFGIASIALNPNGIVFADFEGKIYKVTHKDLDCLDELAHIDQKYIPQKQWQQIIKNDEPEIAKKMIEKLASYLPKEELWPYIEAGLLRKENKLNGLVADSAYKHWEIFASNRELTKIRKNKKYRNNLSVLSKWNQLFAEPTKPVASLNQATDRLVKYSTVVHYHDLNNVRALRTSIALSTDIESLKELSYHDNIHIALASYYALSKINPNEVAYEILSQAVFRAEKTKYSFSSGDVSYGEIPLTLGEAAYDLFSDYLSKKQLNEIMLKDPLLISNTGQRKFNLRSKLVYYTLMNRNIYSGNYDQKVKEWRLKSSLYRNDINEIKRLITEEHIVERLLHQPKMTDQISIAVIDLYNQKNSESNKNISEWIYISFKVHNEASKKLIAYFISGENPNIKIKPIVENLIYQNNWPRDWQDLKQKVKSLAFELNINRE